jgi:alpha-1,6-mannosyltransferase
MKVLDVTEFYSERGGGVRSHLTLKSHVLCQLGHEHVVVAPGAEDDDGLGKNKPSLPSACANGAEKRVQYGARVIRVRGPASPYDPSYHLLLNTRKIREIVARERPDVLEIHSPYAAAFGALRAERSTYGIRTFQWHSDFIDTYGGVLENAFPLLSGRNGSRSVISAVTHPLWWLVRSIARRCDATLVASKWQVRKLTEHGVPNVVHRPFGIERDVFRPEARSLDRRRELLALAGREPTSTAAILVSVGRFAIEKRWEIVIAAFLRLRARGRDAVLVFFGDGPERDRMKALADGSPDVVFAGFTKDRNALASSLASADALVHACPFETFGLSIAEAMSTGLPAVVPDDGGAAEMHDPASGERYSSGSASACADAIERILERIDREGETMRAAATKAASELPTVKEQFEQQIALYSDLSRRRRAGT